MFSGKKEEESMEDREKFSYMIIKNTMERAEVEDELWKIKKTEEKLTWSDALFFFNALWPD